MRTAVVMLVLSFSAFAGSGGGSARAVAVHGDWVGPGVCSYMGVLCAPAPSSGELAVTGVDLNHGNIAGYLPSELGLPCDFTLLHLNSNRFRGLVPDTFRRLVLLHELDLSNNRFVGAFPTVVLEMPSLRFLDLRFNDFEGGVPWELIDHPFDAICLLRSVPLPRL